MAKSAIGGKLLIFQAGSGLFFVRLSVWDGARIGIVGGIVPRGTVGALGPELLNVPRGTKCTVAWGIDYTLELLCFEFRGSHLCYRVVHLYPTLAVMDRNADPLRLRSPPQRRRPVAGDPGFHPSDEDLSLGTPVRFAQDDGEGGGAPGIIA
jgi:hypothetical protein